MEGDMKVKLLGRTQQKSEVDEEEVPLKKRVWCETKKMWAVAGPAVFTRFSIFGVTVVSQAFVGHIGPTELAAYSLVFTVFLRFANGILSKNMIIAYLAAFSVLIHILLSWLLTVKFKFGLPGALLSTTLAYWIPNVGQLLFITCGGCRETWKGFTFLAFKDLYPVVKLSLSAGAMLCLELWYNTILVLLTGNLSNAKVAIDALAICLNINGWEMMISLGFFAAASVRVSNELGRGSSKAAKFSIKMAVLTSFSIGFVLFLIFLFIRGYVAYMFTESPNVVKEVASLSPLLAISILLNSVQPVLSGVAIGAGWQSVVAYVNLASYYLIGIPVGVVLGYVFNLQVKGVWMGMLSGILIQTIVLIVITSKTDWDNQVVIARNRVQKWFVAASEEEHNNNQQDA
ncbi:hypothetical protein HS088_TW15G00703 [Tripterygium wilfordii]|uniref:Uncharacterized protein n=1 Tax=Tripterygium wilfordii TaxID=458696 RepID=A0A7J7CMA2_TRIWF|nr:hypothetical protein HS088_TW15G00703 [Tripterygium wilfordii]